MSDGNNNEMSIFEYLPMSQHFPLIAPQAPTTQIHDIDDVGDPNGPLSGQSYCDSDSEQRKVTPVSGKEEIQKQLSVGFLSVVEYPKWLANVVSIPKKNNKIRVCVSFRDLNKSSPKDDFPLPHIDMFVGSITGHSMLSFMDGVMPFGLKNAGATYQRAVTTLFHDMKHKDVEVYIYIMIEHLCLALVWATRRLSIRDKAHEMVVLLTEFDIQYIMQKSVKVCSISIFRSSPVTNNVVEYKACITGYWRTRDEKLRPYHAYLDLLIDIFDELRDDYATILIENRSTPSYYYLIGNMRIRLGYHGIMIFINFWHMVLTLSQPRPRIGEH
ncbi:hypothetical protein CK203_063412 [Vitis vinifera]|uniref:Uncharacterized protein n=1 Tax=Vitis vinifera TaxID=29760 RepID=A0A438G8W6_VITVI|nr:hypothetical protein CK203_063412 [Vitis vinifera]